MALAVLDLIICHLGEVSGPWLVAARVLAWVVRCGVACIVCVAFLAACAAYPLLFLEVGAWSLWLGGV